MQDSIGIRIKTTAFDTCPVCEKKIRKGQLCLPLHNNRILIGYAHKRCVDIIDIALEKMNCGED